MNKAEIDAYNASYFGIPVAWMPLHNYFMTAYRHKGVEWPQELTDFCNAVYQRIGFCGDVMACAVGDWLKTQGQAGVETLMKEYHL
jgi:hypothetical protein